MTTGHSDTTPPRGGGNPRGPMPVFADRETIQRLFGVPEGTLRGLARELKVACHKLGDERQAKTVYLCEDVEAWVRRQRAPEWVLRAPGRRSAAGGRDFRRGCAGETEQQETTNGTGNRENAR